MESPGKCALEIPSSQCALNLKEAQVHLAGTGVCFIAGSVPLAQSQVL